MLNQKNSEQPKTMYACIPPKLNKNINILVGSNFVIAASIERRAAHMIDGERERQAQNEN